MTIQMKGRNMKKKMTIKNLDCAVCATKLEDAIRKVSGIQNVSISFIREQMKLDIDENREQEIIEEVRHLVRKLEPDVELIEK